MAGKLNLSAYNSFSGIDITAAMKDSKRLSGFEKFVFPIIRTTGPPSILPAFRLGAVWLWWKDG